MAALVNGELVCLVCGRVLGGPWENCHKGWYPRRMTGSYNDSPWAPAFRKDLISFERNTWDNAIESMKVKKEREPVKIENRQDVDKIFNAAR